MVPLAQQREWPRYSASDIGDRPLMPPGHLILQMNNLTPKRDDSERPHGHLVVGVGAESIRQWCRSGRAEHGEGC